MVSIAVCKTAGERSNRSSETARMVYRITYRPAKSEKAVQFRLRACLDSVTAARKIVILQERVRLPHEA